MMQALADDEGRDDSAWATLPSEVVLSVSGALRNSLRDQDTLRQVCRQWSAALAGACTSLEVRGRPPSQGWARRFSELKELRWEAPPSALGVGPSARRRGEKPQTLKHLVSLRLEQATDASLVGLRRLRMPSLETLDLSGCVSLTRVEGLARSLPGLTSLNLAECSRVREQAVKELLRGRPTALASLDLSGTSVTSKALAELKHLPALEELSLEGCFRAVQTDGLAELQHLPGLTALNLSRMVRAGPQLDSIGHLTALTSLNLSQNELAVTDEVLGRLTGLTAITHLDLSDCDRVTDDGLRRLLGHLRQIRVLAIDRCSKVTESGVVQEICRLSSLTSLSMRGCTGIRQQTLFRLSVYVSLGDLPVLTSLYLDGCVHIVTDTEIRLISGIAGLTTLHLAKCPLVTDNGIGWLELLPSLTALDLSELRNVTANGVLSLMRNLPTLKSLRLQNSPKTATDEAFARLNGQQSVLSLTELDLGCNSPRLWSPISDAGLSALSCFPALSRLCLRGCIMVTDVGLEELKHLSALSHLDLRDCISVTDTGLRRGVAHIPILKELDLRGCHRVSARGICALERLSLKILSDHMGDVLERKLKRLGRLGTDANSASVSLMIFGATAVMVGLAAWRTPVGVCRLWSRVVRRKRGRIPAPPVAGPGLDFEYNSEHHGLRLHGLPLWMDFFYLPFAILYVHYCGDLYRAIRENLAQRERLLLL